MNLLLIAIIAINLAGLIVMAVDKQKARRMKWRIPEAMIFLIAVIGGSIGVFLGMRIFRHKTRHWYFTAGIPLIIAVQAFIAYLIINGMN